MGAYNSLPDCTDCNGYGEVSHGYCNSSYDREHMGHNCHGTVCGSYEVECETCEGTGDARCDFCGERAALPQRAGQDAECEPCRIENGGCLACGWEHDGECPED